VKPIRLIIAALILGLQAVAAVGQQSDPADEYLKRGNANLRRGDLAGAIANYDKSLELNPRSAEAHFKRGQVRRAQGNLDEAIEDYEDAVEIDASLVVGRDVADAYYRRGFIKANGLEMDQAISDFTLAIKFNPNDPNNFVKRGESHLVMSKFTEAIGDFDRAIALNPEVSVIVMAYVDRGYAKMQMGRAKESRADFTKGLQLNPDRRFLLELHLRLIEAQRNELKRRLDTANMLVAANLPQAERSQP
jgi:tetratricopeptide (TPR) repeat protein